MRATLSASDFLHLRARFFQIFGAENAAIFREKFADRATSALGIVSLCQNVTSVTCTHPLTLLQKETLQTLHLYPPTL